jgi:hypothetical protein
MTDKDAPEEITPPPIIDNPTPLEEKVVMVLPVEHSEPKPTPSKVIPIEPVKELDKSAKYNHNLDWLVGTVAIILSVILIILVPITVWFGFICIVVIGLGYWGIALTNSKNGRKHKNFKLNKGLAVTGTIFAWFSLHWALVWIVLTVITILLTSLAAAMGAGFVNGGTNELGKLFGIDLGLTGSKGVDDIKLGDIDISGITVEQIEGVLGSDSGVSTESIEEILKLLGGK